MSVASVSIVIPTYNESANVSIMRDKLDAVLGNWQWEVIFIDDDSPDGTSETVAAMAQRDKRVRLIRRIGRRGLSSASIEGFLASTAPFIVLMDADGQHDETILDEMLNRLEQFDLDIVIGSRYIASGRTDGLSTRRRWVSQLATRLSGVVMRDAVQDPMSGYFAMRRQFFESSMRRLSGKGYKILLDILTSANRDVRFVEVPYTFRARMAGQSKLDVNVAAEYVFMLLDKSVGRIIPARFIMFILSGCMGAMMHVLILALALSALGWSFIYGQLTASAFAMVINFIVNNHFTYHDKKLKGMLILPALLKFLLVCSVGAVTNLAVAATLFEHGLVWWFSGLIGAGIGAVWNYAVSRSLTWKLSDS